MNIDKEILIKFAGFKYDVEPLQIEVILYENVNIVCLDILYKEEKDSKEDIPVMNRRYTCFLNTYLPYQTKCLRNKKIKKIL